MNLKGKKAFIAGIGDDQGYGFAIAKELAEAGCEIIIGTWAPIVKIFTTAWQSGKFDESRTLSNGSKMEYQKVLDLLQVLYFLYLFTFINLIIIFLFFFQA